MEGISKIETWWLSEPNKLTTYLYWQKGLILDNEKVAMRDIFEQLDKRYPCPEEYREKWLR